MWSRDTTKRENATHVIQNKAVKTPITPQHTTKLLPHAGTTPLYVPPLFPEQEGMALAENMIFDLFFFSKASTGSGILTLQAGSMPLAKTRLSKNTGSDEDVELEV